MRTQHLQALQRGMIELIEQARRQAHQYPYGVVEAKVHSAALERGAIEFSRLTAVLPSGLEVVVPEECHLKVLPVREALRPPSPPGLLVWLGIPDYRRDGRNVVPKQAGNDPRMHYRYCETEQDLLDDGTGDNPQIVTFRCLNPRLLLDGESQAGLECMPVCRVKRVEIGGGSDFRVELDNAYAPPVLRLSVETRTLGGVEAGGGPLPEQSVLEGLKTLLGLIVQAVETRRSRLGQHLGAVGFHTHSLHGDEFLKLTRLLVLSRQSNRLRLLLRSRWTTPFEFFLSLHELLSELEPLQTGLDLSKDRLCDYDHDAPFPAFEAVSGRLEDALREGEVVQKLEVGFAPDADEPSKLRARLDPEWFTSRIETYYLAVKGLADETSLKTTLRDKARFELTTFDRLGRGQADFAVDLAPVPPWPKGLPDGNDLSYFRMQVSPSRLQSLLGASQELAFDRQNVHVDLSELEFTLYAVIKPEP